MLLGRGQEEEKTFQKQANGREREKDVTVQLNILLYIFFFYRSNLTFSSQHMSDYKLNDNVMNELCPFALNSS